MARAGIQPDQTITFDQDDFLNKREFEDDELVLIVEGKGANVHERGKAVEKPPNFQREKLRTNSPATDWSNLIAGT